MGLMSSACNSHMPQTVEQQFLLLFSLFNGSSTVEAITKDSSTSLATILLPLYEHKDNSLVASLLLTCARLPGLAHFLPRLEGGPHMHSGIFYGRRTSEEEESVPLAELLTRAIGELRALGGSEHEGAFANMLDRRCEQLQKKSMWRNSGSSSWGDGSSNRLSFGDSRWDSVAGVDDDDWDTSGCDGSAWSSQKYYERLEEAAAEAEATASAELQTLSRWRELKTVSHPDRAFTSVLHVAAAGVRNDGICKAPTVSDFALESRALRSCEVVAQISFSGMADYPNTKCPITQNEFSPGDEARQLPSGHLLEPDAFEQLLALAREEKRLAKNPFTREIIPPHVSLEGTRVLASRPLDVLNAIVGSVPRSERGESAVSPSLGFDVSFHAAAKSAVAVSMQQRLASDKVDYAQQTNESQVDVLLLLPDPAKLTTDNNVCAAADAALSQLIGQLEAQRQEDTLYVQEMLPLYSTASNHNH